MLIEDNGLFSTANEQREENRSDLRKQEKITRTISLQANMVDEREHKHGLLPVVWLDAVCLRQGDDKNLQKDESWEDQIIVFFS